MYKRKIERTPSPSPSLCLNFQVKNVESALVRIWIWYLLSRTRVYQGPALCSLPRVPRSSLCQPSAPHQMGGERIHDWLVDWIFLQMFSLPWHLTFVFLSFYGWQLHENDLILVAFICSLKAFLDCSMKIMDWDLTWVCLCICSLRFGVTPLNINLCQRIGLALV